MEDGEGGLSFFLLVCLIIVYSCLSHIINMENDPSLSKRLVIPDILSLDVGVARGVWGVWVSLLGSQSSLSASWPLAWLLAPGWVHLCTPVSYRRRRLGPARTSVSLNR